MRIIPFHLLPYIFCQGKAMFVKFFRGINLACQPVEDFPAGLYLAYDLVEPLFRNVTVRANRAHPGTV